MHLATMRMFGNVSTSLARGRNLAIARLLATAASLDLAVLAQTSLLRTQSAWPSALLFVVASLVGIWALRLVPPPAPLCLSGFAAPARTRTWKASLGLSVAASGLSLALFATNTALTLAWLTFALSVVLIALTGWL